MIKFFACTVILAITSSSTLGVGQKIDFNRKLQCGMQFKCDIKANYSETIVLSSPQGRENAKEVNTFSINAVGKMIIKEVNEVGNSSLIDFQFDNFIGSVNGGKKSISIKGKTLEINLKKHPVSFKIKNSQKELSPIEKQLLSVVFRPSSKMTIQSIMGTNKVVKIGDSWKPCLLAFKQMLAKKKIVCKKSQLDGNVTLVARKLFHNIDCWQVEHQIKTKKIPNFEFDFFVSILLPVKKTGTKSIKVLRHLKEKESKKIADSKNGLVKNQIITISTSDRMDATLIPIQK